MDFELIDWNVFRIVPKVPSFGFILVKLPRTQVTQDIGNPNETSKLTLTKCLTKWKPNAQVLSCAEIHSGDMGAMSAIWLPMSIWDKAADYCAVPIRIDTWTVIGKVLSLKNFDDSCGYYCTDDEEWEREAADSW